MACLLDEEEIFKCPTHPSKRRRTGICPTCLRDRLKTLCPNCANTRPCECCPADTSASTSSSSTFSFFSSVPSGDTQPTMRKSRSLAIPFLRSRSKYAPNLEFTAEKPPLPTAPTNKNIPAAGSGGSSRGKSTSLLSMFKKSKKVREEVEKEKEEDSSKKSNDFMLMMKRSRSVSVAFGSRAGESKAAKTRGWHFPSPFRHSSKTAKVLEEHQSSAIKV
ncbi:Chromatin remodeling 31 [Heracleum sosnowskyi]|uniref:Chromatin remodeling 31 n=1 Tax=Heracleum sosnowskyi TaxID=360622 RepID=A0AAD8HIZ5_9APIA|nr:Chromatin remodeling 31 [Heracleum sosnowskyi]